MQDNKKIIESNITTVFHKAEEYISSKYNLRYNSISLDIESKKKEAKIWQSCNADSLWIELQKAGIKIGQNGLKALIKSDFVERYNPIVEYFETLPKWWHGSTDHIKDYLAYVKLSPTEDRNQFVLQFKKWLVRTIKCATRDGYFNKQAFVLTDDGKGQDLGKSTWCRNICPPILSNYIAEDLSKSDKDTRILICKNLIINLDELAALSRKEINELKSLFSKSQINDRLPYDSKNSIIPRIASFIGSTNKSTFLFDETGSVRWICFLVEDIDWSYKSKFNINLLWSQALALSKDKSFNSEMTKEDLRINELRNDKFQHLTQEIELLNKYFIPSEQNKIDSHFLTTTDICNEIKKMSINSNVNNIQMGKALTASKFQRVKNIKIRGYYVEFKDLSIIP